MPESSADASWNEVDMGDAAIDAGALKIIDCTTHMSNIARTSPHALTRRKGFSLEDPGTDDGTDLIGASLSASTAVKASALTLSRRGDEDGPLSHSLSCKIGLNPVRAGGLWRATQERTEADRPTELVEDCLHARGTFVDAGRSSHFVSCSWDSGVISCSCACSCSKGSVERCGEGRGERENDDCRDCGRDASCEVCEESGDAGRDESWDGGRDN